MGWLLFIFWNFPILPCEAYPFFLSSASAHTLTRFTWLLNFYIKCSTAVSGSETRRPPQRAQPTVSITHACRFCCFSPLLLTLMTSYTVFGLLLDFPSYFLAQPSGCFHSF